MFSTLAANGVTAIASALDPGVVCGVGWGGPGFGWWFLLIPLFWIALFVLIFAVAGRRWRRVAAMRGGSGYGWGPHSPTRSAEQTLAQRYANGDIDEVEYRARLEVLRANRPEGR
jgi:putative membrane protein